VDDTPVCEEYEFGGTPERLKEIQGEEPPTWKQKFMDTFLNQSTI